MLADVDEEKAESVQSWVNGRRDEDVQESRYGLDQ